MKNSKRQLVDDLNGAADLIIQVGHCKGEFTDVYGSHCATGAINTYIISDIIRSGGCLTSNARFNRVAAVKTLVRNAAPCNSITVWNDQPERTKEEVIEMFRRAALLVSAAADEELTPFFVNNVGAGMS